MAHFFPCMPHNRPLPRMRRQSRRRHDEPPSACAHTRLASCSLRRCIECCPLHGAVLWLYFGCVCWCGEGKLQGVNCAAPENIKRAVGGGNGTESGCVWFKFAVGTREKGWRGSLECAAQNTCHKRGHVYTCQQSTSMQKPVDCSLWNHFSVGVIRTTA